MIANLNQLWAATLCDTLVAGGVRQAVVSPGSRSTPLAIAVHAHPGLELFMHPDERSAAFFASGLALASGAPVAIVCTSGTAAANYLPAVIESSQARVPLVVLTADRPPRLRQMGAPQTIDQLHLYGHAVRRFQDLPLPSGQALAALASQVALAVAASVGPTPGPVHLNVPFDEPLAPIPQDVEQVAALAAERRPAPRVSQLPALAPQAALDELSERLADARRPLIVAGPGRRDAGGAALLAFAAAAGVPVVADVGAGLRGLPTGEALVCAHADVFLRHETTAPDLVLRLGAAPTAKGILTYLSRFKPPTIALQPDLEGRDHEAIADLTIVGDVAEAVARVLPRGAEARGAWLAHWRTQEAAVSAQRAEGGLPTEAAAVVSAVRALPGGAAICLSNSLSVRHADTYLGAELLGKTVYTFRGANGIDGVTSAALGVSVAHAGPTLLVTGDLAFLHDLSGLQAARHVRRPVVILLLNNDGGGIFSLLPVASATEAFEPLFGTPHGLGFGPAAALFGFSHTLATSPDAVRTAVTAALAAPGVSLIEFPSNRAETAAAHQAFLAAAGRVHA